MPDVCKRILSIIFHIAIVIVSLKTRMLVYLEKKSAEIVRYLRRKLKISRYIYAAGGKVFVSTVMVMVSLVHTAITCYPVGIEAKRIIIPKALIFLAPFATYPIFSFLVLNLLGTSPTYDKLLKVVGYMILPSVRTLDSMLYFAIRAVSLTILFATVFLGVYHYTSTYSLRMNIVPGTDKFYSIVQELISAVGKHRAFNNVYITSLGVPTPVFMVGIFWDQDIYVSLQGLNLFNLDLRELLGALVHEAGHCYYRHNTIVVLTSLFSTSLLIAAGIWFVIKGEITNSRVCS